MTTCLFDMQERKVSHANETSIALLLLLLEIFFSESSSLPFVGGNVVEPSKDDLLPGRIGQLSTTVVVVLGISLSQQLSPGITDDVNKDSLLPGLIGQESTLISSLVVVVVMGS